MNKNFIFLLTLVIILIYNPYSLFGLEVNEKISLGGTITTVYQWLNHSIGDFPNKNRGSGAIDLDFSLKFTENDEIYILGSFASGNGLKGLSPFILAPNADDLEEDVKNINGHKQQDNILELKYAHTFTFNENTYLKITGGIIDATVYIDDNRFADDEITQFMNDVFVDIPLTTPPSYDLGLVIELYKEPFSVRLLGITTKDGEEGPFYQYYALQLGYTLKSKIGEGNYRIFGFITSEDFYNWKETKKEKHQGIGISIDQDLGFIKNPFAENPIGFFLRAGWQNDEAQVDYNNLISFGLNIPFYFLGKKGNEIGIGYAYLNSPKEHELSNTHAFEGYIKLAIFSHEALSSDLTLDLQYIKDNYKNQKDNEGYILGFRWNFSF